GLLAPPLAVVYFTSSGAEAIEGALKTARKHTRRRRIVAFEGGFHGDTLGALSIGGNPVYRAPFEPLLPDVKFLPFDDVAALAALEGLLREDLPARAAGLGARLLERLRALVGRGALVAARGRGLLLGLEFAEAAASARFARRALERGLILNWTLHRDTVVRLAPPLVLSDAEAERAVEGIVAALG